MIFNVLPCLQTNAWRKVRAQRGCAVPRGRRGHTALVHRGQMLIYGGYQDLRGSSPELWAFHFGKKKKKRRKIFHDFDVNVFFSCRCFRDGILAPFILEREWASCEAQTLGGVARWRDVHLRRNDRPAGEKRLLEMGREHCLLVPIKEQTGTWPPPRPRCLQATQLHADFRRGERWSGHERTLEVSFR